MINFNRKQINAIALVFDNIATALIVGIAIASFTETNVGIVDAIVVAIFSVVLIVLATILRSGED